MKKLLLIVLLAISCVSLHAQRLANVGLDGGYTTDKIVAQVDNLDDSVVSNSFDYRGFYLGGEYSIPFLNIGLQFRYQSLVGQDNPSSLYHYAPDKQMFLEVPVSTKLGLPIVRLGDAVYVMASLKLGVLPSFNLNNAAGYEDLKRFDIKLLGGASIDIVDIGGEGSLSFYMMVRKGMLDLDNSDQIRTNTNGFCYGLNLSLNLGSL